MATKDTPLAPKIISALTARTQFGQIMRRARQRQERFVVDRRGEPQVVIMSVRDFLKTMAPESKPLAALRAASVKSGRSRMSMRQIDKEIRAYRREEKLSRAKTGRRS
ncbi:MAG TPA: type II toxin-antitoxin system Phd/YefM family antitoxin [Terriglobales bacterium]|nr:type II toxin-antitoxin system Phd/YefM family antitoxin [Terriglobales bacterium]